MKPTIFGLLISEDDLSYLRGIFESNKLLYIGNVHSNIFIRVIVFFCLISPAIELSRKEIPQTHQWIIL